MYIRKNVRYRKRFEKLYFLDYESAFFLRFLEIILHSSKEIRKIEN